MDNNPWDNETEWESEGDWVDLVVTLLVIGLVIGVSLSV